MHIIWTIFCFTVMSFQVYGDSKLSVGVVFGDSLAEGVGSTEGNDLASCLSRSKELNTKFLNLGIAGETSFQIEKRVDEVLKQNPKVVIVSAGGNDVLFELRKTLAVLTSPPDGKHQKFSFHGIKTLQIIRDMYIKLVSNGIKVVHLGISPPYRNPIDKNDPNLDERLKIFFKKYPDFVLPKRDSRLENIASVTSLIPNAYYAPKMMGGLWDDPILMFDAVHPNDDGYKIVCERLTQFLRNKTNLN